jgi:hypothetical protein
VARNENPAMVAPMVKPGGVCFYRNSGVWSQAVGFVLVLLQESYFSRSEEVFTFIFFVQEILFPSDLTGHTMLVLK